MSDETRKCVENAVKTINAISASKREMAARLAETYAAGLATGMELAEEANAAAKTGKEGA